MFNPKLWAVLQVGHRDLKERGHQNKQQIAQGRQQENSIFYQFC